MFDLEFTCHPSFNVPKLFDIQVGMETEGFAIYDAMMQLKNEVCFLVKTIQFIPTILLVAK